MFGMRPIEIILVLGVILLLFGAKRLPEMGKSLGSALRGFKKSVSGEDEEAPRAELPPAKPGDKPEGPRA
jgi:sec-independent protein translocase protein TatA